MLANFFFCECYTNPPEIKQFQDRSWPVSHLYVIFEKKRYPFYFLFCVAQNAAGNYVSLSANIVQCFYVRLCY